MLDTPGQLRAAIYVPHGAIPDVRGYAPAIVAWQFAQNMKSVSPVIVCGREHHKVRHEVIHGIPIHRLREGRLYRRLFRKITRLDPYPLHRRAADLLAQEPWDLLHAHQLEFAVRDFRQRIKQRRPVILHAHVTTNVFDPDRGEADRYVAASSYIRERLVNVKGYPHERVVVVPNGVDVELFAPPTAELRLELRSRFGLPASAVVAAFVGRKQEVKGFHVFLEAMNALLPKHPDLYVIAAGPDLAEAGRERSYPQRQQLRKQLQASGRFRDFPAMPQAALAEVLRAADLTLLPSQAEPQGMAMIESMASGCITISSNIGGIRESIQHGVTGFLLDSPGNADEAIAVCERLLHSVAGQSALRERARADVVTRFSWEVVATRLEQVYREVVSSAG